MNLYQAHQAPSNQPKSTFTTSARNLRIAHDGLRYVAGSLRRDCSRNIFEFSKASGLSYDRTIYSIQLPKWSRSIRYWTGPCAVLYPLSHVALILDSQAKFCQAARRRTLIRILLTMPSRWQPVALGDWRVNWWMDSGANCGRSNVCRRDWEWETSGYHRVRHVLLYAALQFTDVRIRT